MLQAPLFEGLSLDPFALFDDGLGPAEVGIGGRHVAQALMVSPVIVMFGEGLDLSFEIARQEVVFQQDTIFEGLVPALDLALGLGKQWSAAHMAHALRFDELRQFARDIAGTVVAEQL